jgi:hypothetical protein
VNIIDSLLNSLQADAPVRQVLVGAFWTAVVLDTDPTRCGLASTLRAETHDESPPARAACRAQRAGVGRMAALAPDLGGQHRHGGLERVA